MGPVSQNRMVYEFRRLCPLVTEEDHRKIAAMLDSRTPPGTGRAYDNYVYRLYWLAWASRARRIVELGATPGTSTIALTMALRHVGGGHLWSCDIAPLSAEYVTNCGFPIDGFDWTRVSPKTAAEFGREWSGGPVDLIYLDASHTFEDTAAEIEAWFPHLREGGLFVFHDVEACRATVFTAISEAMRRRGCCLEYHHFNDCHGHGVLQWYRNERFNPPVTPGNIESLTTLLVEATGRRGD
jgi:predicted O-methyltransferase YrrM